MKNADTVKALVHCPMLAYHIGKVDVKCLKSKLCLKVQYGAHFTRT